MDPTSSPILEEWEMRLAMVTRLRGFWSPGGMMGWTERNRATFPLVFDAKITMPRLEGGFDGDH